MNATEKEYIMARKKRSDRVKHIFAIVSIVSFGGSAVFGTAQLFNRAFQQPSESATTAAKSAESPLEGQARGYELVLQREPENQTALEGLVSVRLQMNDPKRAIKPLETLIKLAPDRTDYKTLLEQVKQKTEGSDRP